MLPKAEGPLYLSATGVDVQTARPGRGSWVWGRSGAPLVVFHWTRNAFVTVAPPLGASPVEQVGVKGGREWVPVCARVRAQNVVYATNSGNWWERSSQKCGMGRG